MCPAPNQNLQLEIGHVLFIDIVGYSKLLINEQIEVLEKLNELVRATERVRAAEAAGKLMRLPAGDGMALVFRDSPEAAAQCALEIAAALKSYPEVQVRMGIHSGPINEVADVNQRANIAGGGINIAQRVMDCGDAGHILLSKRVADDLAQYRHWQPLLHDLGECEVKHGTVISVANLYTTELGNPKVPEKFQRAKENEQTAVPTGSAARSKPRLITLAILICLLIGLAIVAVIFAPAAPKFFSQQRAAAPNAAPSAAPIASTPAIPEKSIAVLPFENLSENKENAFFADGVQDEILTYLAKVAELKVISRTSVIGYRDISGRNLRKIGQELAVAHLLEGSVQRAGNRVRINAQLVDARTDAHLWAETYDRDLADVFAIQSEIAQQIANQLKAKLSPNEKAAIEERPTKDLIAYDLYLRGKALFLTRTIFNARAKDNLLEAARLLDQAVARDAEFFAAYCLLSSTHGYLYFLGFDHTPERRTLAERAVNAALRLRPEAGEAQFARAEYLYRCYLDYEHARAELAIAQQTLPNGTEVFALMGYIDRRQSRWDESTRNLEKALQLDPRNQLILQQTGLSYQSMRRYAEAEAAFDRVREVAPSDIGARVNRALIALESNADPKPLLEEVHAVIGENPGAAADIADRWLYGALCARDWAESERALEHLPPNGVAIDLPAFPVSWWQAMVARVRGDETAAHDTLEKARVSVEKTVREQPDFGPAICLLGLIDAGLGRKEEAIREGQRAVALLPVSKDSVNGTNMIKYLGVIYAWTGEQELALQQIAATLAVPADLGYGQLRLHPYWDPLRGDPHFEKIVASLAPKEAKQ